MSDNDGSGRLEPARVRFDSKDPQKTISVEDASAMLTAWRDRNPKVFGYWLSVAITGVAPGRTGADAKQ